MDPFDLTGTTALVSGSSRGIGRALAKGLLQAGSRVTIHGRNRDQVEATALDLAEETGGETGVSTFDVTDQDAVDRGIADIEREWGTPDILVNNAGIQRRAPFTEFTLQDWNDLVATNLTSAFLVSQRAARGMVQRGSGKIINIGSVQSQLARPGIHTNAFAPGYFENELTQALVEDEQFTQWVPTRTPAGRWGKVEDLVGALVFLASPASNFVNGQVLFVDGGMTAVV